MSDDESEDYEEQTYFVGQCTCGHEREEHTWGSCDVLLPDGTNCPCEAGWEE